MSKSPTSHDFEGKPVWLSQLIDLPPVEWIWPGRIPRGHLSILEGAPGIGKTMLLCDIASKLSRAMALPDVPEAKRCHRMKRTLFLSAEDDPSTIKGRVLAAGGELTSIGVLEDLMTFPNHAEALRAMVHDYGIDLVVIDPINSFLAASIDAYRDTDVRRALGPLRDVARLQGCGIILIRHLIKSGQGPAMNRGIGSIAFTGLARVVLQLVPHGDGFALAWAKGNLSKAPSALPFTIQGDENPKIVWGEPMAGTADDFLNINATITSSNADQVCAAFIEKLVMENGPMLTNAIRDSAEHQGWTGGTFKRAQQLLKAKGIITFNESGRWMTGFKTPFDS